ncbi:hypothetical protein DM02DRAFT_176848 [Periconia macrospinosa]|uniref:Uncharacterized protein n=1 Tax=Periconia macrospinosa TaxID=97972 RepID=A0A2V1E1I0_9PLEO|nr:hypothetical protein DM02DRAFT_176848 [Periconia macrospinosa]
MYTTLLTQHLLNLLAFLLTPSACLACSTPFNLEEYEILKELAPDSELKVSVTAHRHTEGEQEVADQSGHRAKPSHLAILTTKTRPRVSPLTTRGKRRTSVLDRGGFPRSARIRHIAVGGG